MFENDDERVETGQGDTVKIDGDEPIVFDDEKLHDEGIEDESGSDEEKNAALEEEAKENYSRNVQKRIDKLTYERNVERERTARLEQENKQNRERLEALEKSLKEDRETRTKSTLEQQRHDLIGRKKEALEMGDYDAVVKIDDELFDMKVKSAVTPQGEQPRTDSTQQTQSVQSVQRNPLVSDVQAAWEEKNPWLYDDKQTVRKDRANQIFQDLLQKEGFAADDPETYEVLDRRLKRQAPPPPGGVDRGQATSGRNDVSFTSDDRNIMEGWGLDPSNPVHRAEYLKNKGKG